MTLTQGINTQKILQEFSFPSSVIGVALNAKQEVVECISYDVSNDDARYGVFNSMVYNGWIEEGKKQSAYRYANPNELWKSYTFLSLASEEEKTDFLSKVLPIPESELEDLNHMVDTGRGVMVKDKKEAAQRYPHLFAYNLIYFDGFGPAIRLRTLDIKVPLKVSPKNTNPNEFVAHFFRSPEAGEIGAQGFYMAIESSSLIEATKRAEEEAEANDWRLLSVELRNEKHEPYLKG